MGSTRQICEPHRRFYLKKLLNEAPGVAAELEVQVEDSGCDILPGLIVVAGLNEPQFTMERSTSLSPLDRRTRRREALHEAYSILLLRTDLCPYRFCLYTR